MADNSLKVQQAFRILHPFLAGYVAKELRQEYQDSWWQEVLTALSDQMKDLPDSGDYAALVDSLDIANCLRLFDRKWNDLFKKKLSQDYRTWGRELMSVRNKLAHLGGQDFNDDDTWRALDTMSRLCEAFDAEATEEIRELLREARYGSASGSTAVTETPMVPATAKKKAGILDTTPINGLPCWRDVIQPHPDVAQGRYKNAEFAADIAQVARGEGVYEYRDPVEFFARTYVTEGMTGLLEQALRRVAGKDGEPVIQLKTAFGGGKTHSLLALYHMLRAKVSIDKIPNIKPVLERAGVESVPRTNVAVLVGTALDPTKTKRPQNFPGITISTLWGEMAAQLAESAGDPKLYDYIKEADKKGVSPGSETLKNLFDACGPCLVLMDELVAYARKIYGNSNLPAGTFDNFISFIQEVTEAARASQNSLVVASIPESDIEISGNDVQGEQSERNATAGKIALEMIEHTFGRMESIWKPVAANEGFEVVRRRLFLDCKDPDARDAVCAKFSQMYNENQGDFPIESREVEYRNRMISCYPIHPEIFDRLYEDWATLEHFQRTRGVLRLMAAVIHELWMGGDASLLIMPGSIPMDVPTVRDELTRRLPEGWNALVDREVDGRSSIPYQKDKPDTRYGKKMASRRVARTIMLGSAPTSLNQNVRGIEASRIRLGVVQPGENISIFNDALNTLATSLAYLYTNPSSNRFWYDTRPTLRKTVEDRATQVAVSDVEYEIETRLRAIKKEPPFAGIHACPSSSLDVLDDRAARLVVLCPSDTYRTSDENNSAMTAVIDILNNRGTTPRIYRNMIAFVAPDQDLMLSLQQTVRRFLAWKSIKEDSEDLNLDAAQNRETDNNLARFHRTVDDQIKEAYCWLLIPYIDKDTDLNIIWDKNRIGGGNDSIISRAATKMRQNEQIITRWAPALLRMELDNVLWTSEDHIQIKTLWDCLCKYCYLPRLAAENVLLDAISSGLASAEYFAYASGFDGKRYLDLKLNQSVEMVEPSAYLVKIPVAQRQFSEDEAKRQAAEGEARAQAQTTQQEIGNDLGGTSAVLPHVREGIAPHTNSGVFSPIPPVEQPRNKRFYMSVPLDTTRIGRDVQRLVEEIITHLTTADGTQVEVSLEVNVQAPKGLSQEIVRTVSENCKTLHIEDFGFEE